MGVPNSGSLSALAIAFSASGTVRLSAVWFAEGGGMFMLFDMDFDGDVDVFDNVTEFMLANGELTGDEDSDDGNGWWEDSDLED